MQHFWCQYRRISPRVPLPDTWVSDQSSLWEKNSNNMLLGSWLMPHSTLLGPSSYSCLSPGLLPKYLSQPVLYSHPTTALPWKPNTSRPGSLCLFCSCCWLLARQMQPLWKKQHEAGGQKESGQNFTGRFPSCHSLPGSSEQLWSFFSFLLP